MTQDHAGQSGWGPAVQRLCAGAGIPLPPPMTDEEIRAWGAKQDAADAEAERFWAAERGRAAAA